MKKILIISLILTGFISFSGVVSASSDVNGKKTPGYISLSASKTIEQEPNIARVSFAVENTAETAQKAAGENNEISNQIINALKSVTSSETDVIRTNNFSVRPIYSNTRDGKRVIKNYMAVNSVSVETKDTKKIAKVIDSAIAAGANRTDSLSYTYQNDDSLCSQTYPILLKGLKNQADEIAKSVGSEVDGIRNINVSCSSENSIVSNGRFYAAKAVSADGIAEEAVSAPIEAGKVKIRVYVNADFYVK